MDEFIWIVNFDDGNELIRHIAVYMFNVMCSSHVRIAVEFCCLR